MGSVRRWHRREIEMGGGPDVLVDAVEYDRAEAKYRDLLEEYGAALTAASVLRFLGDAHSLCGAEILARALKASE